MMGYRELIKKVQQYSGFSKEESKDALENTVEVIAIHLNEGERKDFASQLPEKLQDMALAVQPTEETAKQDIVEQIMQTQHISRDHAKKQLVSAWKALKDAITYGEIEHIRAQLPSRTLAILY